jgi:tetratricopeptide (TPR) repeat protein
MKTVGTFIAIVAVAVICSGTVLVHADSWKDCYVSGKELCEAGQWTQALQKAKMAARKARSEYGSTHCNYAKAEKLLGDICASRGQLHESALHRNVALKVRKALHGDNHPSVVKLLTAMADTYSLHGETSRAQELYREALAGADTREGTLPYHMVPALEGLALLQYSEGDLQQAEKRFEKTLKSYRLQRAYSPAKDVAIGRVATYLGHIAQIQEQPAKAAEFYRLAIAKFSRSLGPASPVVARSQRSLGELYSRQGNQALAMSFLKRALGSYESSGFPEDANVAATLTALARIHEQMNKPAEAMAFRQRALNIYSKASDFDRAAATQFLRSASIWSTPR